MRTPIKIALFFIASLLSSTAARHNLFVTIRSILPNENFQLLTDYEKLKLKLCKLKLDIEFLRVCLNYDLIPSFAKFKTVSTFTNSNFSRIAYRLVILNEYRTKSKLLLIKERQIVLLGNEIQKLFNDLNQLKLYEKWFNKTDEIVSKFRKTTIKRHIEKLSRIGMPKMIFPN